MCLISNPSFVPAFGASFVIDRGALASSRFPFVLVLMPGFVATQSVKHMNCVMAHVLCLLHFSLFMDAGITLS